MARNRICRAMAQPSTAQWTRVANMQVKRRRASGIERDNPSGVERRSTSGVVQKRAEKLNYALAVLLSFLCPGTPLAPRSYATLLRPSSPSSNSSSSRTGNRQIFCYLRINIFIEFASVESEREGGWAAPTGVWFHPFSARTPFGHLFFGPVKNCVNMLVISTCLSLCAVVHLALDKQ